MKITQDVTIYPICITDLHPDVTAQDRGDSSEHKRARSERGLDPRILAQPHEEKDYGTEHHNENSTDSVLRREKGIRTISDGLINLQ